MQRSGRHSAWQAELKRRLPVRPEPRPRRLGLVSPYAVDAKKTFCRLSDVRSKTMVDSPLCAPQAVRARRLRAVRAWRDRLRQHDTAPLVRGARRPVAAARMAHGTRTRQWSGRALWVGRRERSRWDPFTLLPHLVSKRIPTKKCPFTWPDFLLGRYVRLVLFRGFSTRTPAPSQCSCAAAKCSKIRIVVSRAGISSRARAPARGGAPRLPHPSAGGGL